MIKIEKVDVYGFENAIRGARNSWDSHSKSDSKYVDVYPEGCCTGAYKTEFVMGENDHALLMRLVKNGDSHAKCMRMVKVWFDLTAPRAFWTEFDTYHYVIRCSESTMHTITKRKITLDDFTLDGCINGARAAMQAMIDTLNRLRERYLNPTKEDLETGEKKRYWRSLIMCLPQSYMQKSTICTNYQTLRNMYHQRKGHKLQEWAEFRKWCESLPYSELITTVSGREEIVTP